MATVDNLETRVIALEGRMALVYNQVQSLLNATPNLTIFDSPVGTVSERAAWSDFTKWPGDWFDASPFATLYMPNAYHTGADLNRPNYADAGQPIYSCADGTVVFAGTVPGWQADVVVVRHVLDNGLAVYLRYAHIISDFHTASHDIPRGYRLGTIADYAPKGPSGDHLHFDIAKINLGIKAGDWPGMDKPRLVRDYYPPLQFIRENHT